MLIFLGKNELSQTDRQERRHSGTFGVLSFAEMLAEFDKPGDD